VGGHAAPYAFRNWPWPNHLNAPEFAYGCTQGNPDFDAKVGQGEGNFLEKHTSPIDNQTITPAFLDARPYGLLNAEKVQTVSKVGTYVFKVTSYSEVGFDEKRNNLLVTAGHHTARDVSAAGFTLPDTSAYWYNVLLGPYSR